MNCKNCERPDGSCGECRKTENKCDILIAILEKDIYTQKYTEDYFVLESDMDDIEYEYFYKEI